MWQVILLSANHNDSYIPYQCLHRAQELFYSGANELYGCVQSGFTPDETEVLKWEVHARHEILFGAEGGNVSKYKPFSVLNVWFVFYLP